MIDDLRVDLAGAVAVAEAAASFDWTWDVSDIERFCDHMGWDEPTPSRHDDTLMWARTELDAEDAVATFRFRGRRLDTVTLPVGDDGCGLGEPGAAAFDEVTAALRDAFGDPTGERISARRGPSWTFADLVVGVAHGTAIELLLVDPLDQDHWARGDRWAGAAARAAAAFVELVPRLVRADFGTWSRQEIETGLTTIGLLPFTKDGGYGRGWAGDLLVCVGEYDISVLDAMDERPGGRHVPGRVRRLPVAVGRAGSPSPRVYR